MTRKRKIEIFSAGCPICDDAIGLVRRIACESCDVTVADLRNEQIAARAASYGIRSVPAVVIDGVLADCCLGRGVDEAVLRADGIGAPIT